MESQKKVKHQRGTDYHKGTKSLNNIGELSVFNLFYQNRKLVNSNKIVYLPL